MIGANQVNLRILFRVIAVMHKGLYIYLKLYFELTAAFCKGDIIILSVN